MLASHSKGRDVERCTGHVGGALSRASSRATRSARECGNVAAQRRRVARFPTQMVERFESFGVTKELIERRIQRHLTALTPAMAVSLRKIYNSLRDGMSAPAEWFEMPANVAAASGDSRTASVKSRMKARRTPRASRDADAANDASASDTGEAPPTAGSQTAPTYAQIANAINESKTLEALNDATDMIRGVSNEAHRNELAELYSVRAAEFDEGA